MKARRIPTRESTSRIVLTPRADGQKTKAPRSKFTTATSITLCRGQSRRTDQAAPVGAVS